MTTFDELTNDMDSDIFKHLGREVTLTKSGGLEAIVTAMLDEGVEAFGMQFDVGSSDTRTEISFIAADVVGIKRDDLITAGTYTYVIGDKISSDGDIIKFSVVKR